MDLPESSFDAALCRLGLMFIEELDAGVSKIYKSLDKGGVLRLVFGQHQKRFLNLRWLWILKQGAHISHLHLLPCGIPGPFSLADENILNNSYYSGIQKISKLNGLM